MHLEGVRCWRKAEIGDDARLPTGFHQLAQALLEIQPAARGTWFDKCSGTAATFQALVVNYALAPMRTIFVRPSRALTRITCNTRCGREGSPRNFGRSGPENLWRGMLIEFLALIHRTLSLKSPRDYVGHLRIKDRYSMIARANGPSFSLYEFALL